MSGVVFFWIIPFYTAQLFTLSKIHPITLKPDILYPPTTNIGHITSLDGLILFLVQ